MAHIEHTPAELSQLIATAASAKGAEDILAFDVSAQNPYTDAQMLVSGSSERNVGAIAEGIVDDLLDMGIKARRREGFGAGRWALIDFGLVTVHVFHEEERAYYGLERLWRDADVIKLELPK